MLGPLEVEDDGRAIPIGPAKERTLLAVLLLGRGRAVSADRLIDAIWADDPPATAAKIVQVYVAHLRRALGSDRIVTRGRGYELVVEDGEVDLDRFERLVREAATAEPEQASTLLGAALGLVRGPPLADLALEPWAVPEAHLLGERVLEANEARIDADLALGRHRQLVVELEELCAQHPFREHLLGQLLLALYGSGRQADALAAYRRGVARLRDELGLEPGPALQELEGRMLRHDPTLAVARARTTRARRRSWRLITAGALGLLAAAAAAVVLALTSSDGTALGSVPPGVAVVDARNGQLVAHIPTTEIAQPVEAVTGGGAFWVWNLRPFSLVQVDPSTGRIRSRIASPFGGDAGWFLPVGNDVWFTGKDEIARVDAREARVVDRTPISREQGGRFGLTWLTPCAGSIWAVDGDNSSVLRLDRRTARVRARIAVQYPWAIACGDGGLWVTSNFSGLSRIDPKSNAVVATAPIPTHLNGVVVAGGFAWTTDEQRGTLYKVDGTGRIAATYETGDGARQLSVAGGRVWVANGDVGTVTGVDVTTGDVKTFRFGHPVQTVAALGDRLLVELNDGLTYEDRIDQLRGSVAKLIAPIYVFDPADPALAWNPWAFLVERATCSTLLAYSDPAHSATALRPDLATAMPRVSNDGRTYTFTVWTGRRFAPPSGALVTAASIRASIERALSPKLAGEAPGVQFMRDLAGVARYRAGDTPHIDGIRVRGKHDLVLSHRAIRFLPGAAGTAVLLHGAARHAGIRGWLRARSAKRRPVLHVGRLQRRVPDPEAQPRLPWAGAGAVRRDRIREGLAPEKAVARVKSGEWDGALLDDALIGPDSAVARQARRGSQLRYEVLSDRSIRGPAPPVYALLSSRLGCSASGGALDLAALCAREQDQ